MIGLALLITFVAAYLTVAFCIDRGLPACARLGWSGVAVALLALAVVVGTVDLR